MTCYRSITMALVLTLTLASCGPNPVPRPRAFFRIDLPEKKYQLFDADYPYVFEYPVYASINTKPSDISEPWWLNIEIPQFKASVHISYKQVDNNIAHYLDDTHRMLAKQFSKASGIREDMIMNENDKVFGIIYHIRGLGVASPCQFFVTDSTNHFLRGALYFNVIPNNDSLAPVIDFLKEDIRHMVSTLQWQ
jgi:gliding motility-associated lipoprotein GldD